MSEKGYVIYNHDAQYRDDHFMGCFWTLASIPLSFFQPVMVLLKVPHVLRNSVHSS